MTYERLFESQIAERFAHVKDESGLTYREWEKLSGVSASTLNRMATGDRVGTITNYYLALRVLGMTVGEFFGDAVLFKGAVASMTKRAK